MPPNTGTKVIEYRTSTSDEARRLLDAAAEKVFNRYAPIRRTFVRGTPEGIAPLVSMMRGGRGGQVRLKLYTSMLWQARTAPHQTDYPARHWARLLDLRDPMITGARRITDAISWLEHNMFLRVEKEPGKPSIIHLLSDDGSGASYSPPWKEKGGRGYIKLPADFWKQGWIAVLSGTACSMLLVLAEAQDFRNPEKAFWVTPREARERYGFSPDTWTKGITELKFHGIVDVAPKPVNYEEFGWLRRRNLYTLNIERLSQLPGSPLPIDVIIE
jgi:hypothetical protein